MRHSQFSNNHQNLVDLNLQHTMNADIDVLLLAVVATKLSEASVSHHISGSGLEIPQPADSKLRLEFESPRTMQRL